MLWWFAARVPPGADLSMLCPGDELAQLVQHPVAWNGGGGRLRHHVQLIHKGETGTREIKDLHKQCGQSGCEDIERSVLLVKIG